MSRYTCSTLLGIGMLQSNKALKVLEQGVCPMVSGECVFVIKLHGRCR